MGVKLIPVDKSNWRKVAKLQVHDDQSEFVAYNWYSMLEAIFDGWGGSVAIVNDADEIVGYSMYDAFPEKKFGYICRFMIDKEHQRKGYGRAGMQLILDDLRQREGLEKIKISVIPSNKGAIALYESLGFRHVGEWEEDEMVLEMPVQTLEG